MKKKEQKAINESLKKSPILNLKKDFLKTKIKMNKY